MKPISYDVVKENEELKETNKRLSDEVTLLKADLERARSEHSRMLLAMKNTEVFSTNSSSRKTFCMKLDIDMGQLMGIRNTKMALCEYVAVMGTSLVEKALQELRSKGMTV